MDINHPLFLQSIAKYRQYQIPAGDPGSCWGWRGPTNLSGYAQVFVGGNNTRKAFTASHITCALLGYIPESHERVRASCGNKTCTNPNHFKHIDIDSGATLHTHTALRPGYNDRKKSETFLKVADELGSPLAPLLIGKTVILQMEQIAPTQGRKFSATPKVVTRTVLLVPGVSMGIDRNLFLVALIGKGSQMIAPRMRDRKSDLANLVLAGFPAKLANVLMDEFHRILEV